MADVRQCKNIQDLENNCEPVLAKIYLRIITTVMADVHQCRLGKKLSIQR